MKEERNKIPFKSGHRHKNLCIRMLRAASIAVAKDWKQPKCRSTVQWVNKLWTVHTTEYLSAVKRKQMRYPTAHIVFH